jgi:hypothetical protein
MGKRATLPQGIKAFIDPNTTNTPLVENASSTATQIGTGVAAENIADTDTVMPITHQMGGRLTATGTIDFSNGIDPTTGVAGVNATGKRLLYLELEADANSANNIIIAPGAANPYPVLGTANDIEVPPGAHLPLSQRKKSDGTAPAQRFPLVAAGAKTLDVTISGSGALEWHAGFGD